MQKLKSLSLFVLVLLMLVLPRTPIFSQKHQETRHQATGNTITLTHQETGHQATGNTRTFNPTIIPLSAPEIGNPMRGPEYYGTEQPPPNFPLIQYYHRWCWSEIEPTEGNYNFSLIDNLAAQAKANGGTFGWRIMPIDGTSTTCIPAYLKALMPKGFVQGSVYVPDFNDPNYLARVQAMVTAFAQRYNNDPRIDLLDMSYYGCWGEWNEACFSYPSPTGATLITAANRQALIDMQVKAFSNKRFLMLTNYQDSLNYALGLQRSKPIGVRIDDLGDSSLGGARYNLDNNPIENNQWKIAPLYFEYGNSNFKGALADIQKYHASLLGDGDGNLNDFSSYPPAQQSLMIQNFKAAGYRFEINSLTLPDQLVSNTPFTVTTQWTNVNTAPAYIPWNVMMQLRTSAGQIVWQGQSQINLQVPFTDTSLGNDTKTVTDTFTLPGTIPTGTYSVAVQVIDAGKYYPPMNLAIQGKQADGSYALGTIGVSGGSGQATRIGLYQSLPLTIPLGSIPFFLILCPWSSRTKRSNLL